jgi:hypothetical protein
VFWQQLGDIEVRLPSKRTQRFFMPFAFLSTPRERGGLVCF